MNVFLYSEDKLLLLAAAEAIRKAGETPFIASDFQTLQSLIIRTDPDIAFVDEALFPPEKIQRLQKHIFDILLDFPVSSITNPYITEYRGKVSEYKFRLLAAAVMCAAHEHISCQRNYKGLSPKLSSLLSFLLMHKNENIETAMMMNHLWKDCSAAHIKTLRTYICKLREKLKESGNSYSLEKIAKSTYCLRSTTD